MAEEVRVREIGAINWIGLRTLYVKEVQRFLKVFIQTVLAPVIQTLLFMAVLALAWGKSRGEVLGAPFTEFLAPGLVMMAILGNSFQNSSSSLMVAKIQGISVDFLMPPLSAAELTTAFVGGAATRGILVGLVSMAAVAPFVGGFGVANPAAAVYFPVAASIMMGAAGVLGGVWAEKFDHLAAVGNFVITPMTFLSGTFYSVSVLPDSIETLTRWNPFFHLIDGFRSGFIGTSDGAVLPGAIYVGAVDAVLVGFVYWVMRSGWRLKA